MAKPVVGPYGEYVTTGEKGHVTNAWTFGGDVGVYATKACLCENRNWTAYATREAAEMALIRAKCIRRLKEMAYGDGWLPDFNEDKEIHHIPLMYHFNQMCPPTIMQAGGIALPVFFKNRKMAFEAYETITPEERAAFLYIYKPEEDN